MKRMDKSNGQKGLCPFSCNVNYIDNRDRTMYLLATCCEIFCLPCTCVKLMAFKHGLSKIFFGSFKHPIFFINTS